MAVTAVIAEVCSLPWQGEPTHDKPNPGGKRSDRRRVPVRRDARWCIIICPCQSNVPRRQEQEHCRGLMRQKREHLCSRNLFTNAAGDSLRAAKGWSLEQHTAYKLKSIKPNLYLLSVLSMIPRPNTNYSHNSFSLLFKKKKKLHTWKLWHGKSVAVRVKRGLNYILLVWTDYQNEQKNLNPKWRFERFVIFH